MTTIRAEVGKPVELSSVSNALWNGDFPVLVIDSYRIGFEGAALGILAIGSIDQRMSIRRPAWREVGYIFLAVIGDGPQVAAIRIHHIQVQCCRSDQVTFEQGKIIDFFLLGLRMVGAEADPLAIRRPPGSAIVAQSVGQLPRMGAIDIHYPDVQITAAITGKHDFFAIG